MWLSFSERMSREGKRGLRGREVFTMEEKSSYLFILSSLCLSLILGTGQDIGVAEMQTTQTFHTHTHILDSALIFLTS